MRVDGDKAETSVEAGIPVVVVGGGLAGLMAAAQLARAGVPVVVCERANQPGGRAVTHVAGDYRLNLGPHALYLGGAAARELRALGLPLTGGIPPGGWALRHGKLHTFPGGALSLLTTGLLPFAAKLRAVPLLAWLGRFGAAEAAQLASVSAAQWIAERAPEPALAELMAALIRISTYTADLQRLSAGAALGQLASAASHGVRYLDGGWQTLVDGVAAAAVVAGAIVWPRAAVSTIEQLAPVAVEPDGRAPLAARFRVRLSDGRTIDAGAVIIAAGPQVAASLVPGSGQLAHAAASATPVRAACLDLALTSLPRPRAQFALGVDRPLYFSLHSAVARLAPTGGAVLHVARYLDGSADDDEAAEAELEALCDRLQPGWRERVVERRYLPRMVVTQDMPRAEAGGLAGRAAAVVADVPGLYVAGDWVGPEGMLADAAVASAVAAVRAVLDARAAGQRGARAAA